LDAPTAQETVRESVMSDVSADFKDQAGPQREPTKLECGMLGALGATIVLASLFWLGIQLSVLQLMIHIP
jgi:hypothetical protein